MHGGARDLADGAFRGSGALVDARWRAEVAARQREERIAPEGRSDRRSEVRAGHRGK
jgi:hypothetical protein